jgi:D-glycero-D-manno-heptose 1,7-bisphosphate phosphatase
MECCCRKPLPGLFTCASAEMNIELKNSWMIGNSIVDVKAGTAAGCSTVLLESMGKDNKESSTIEASMTLRDVRELLTMILSQSADFYKRN